MSWSVSVTKVEAADLHERLREGFENNNYTEDAKVKGQYDAALDAASELLRAIKIEDNTELTVALNGHVKQAEGGADSEISVRVVAHGK